MREVPITTTMIHDRNDTTATTRSIRRRITMRTTTSHTIPHHTTRARTRATAHSQITTGKMSRMAGRCWEAPTRTGQILTT